MRKNHLNIAGDSANIRALLVAEHIDLKTLSGDQPSIASSPLTLKAGKHGCVVLFKYGAVVFCNVPYEDEAKFLGTYKNLFKDTLEVPETEEIEIKIESSSKAYVSGGTVSLEELTIEKIQLIAELLSKSLILAYYEKHIAKSFDSIEPIALKLKQKRFFDKSAQKYLLEHIGDTLLCMHKMIGRVGVSEKPDVLWDHPELERLYIKLEMEYELSERHMALDAKIDVISKTLETVLGLSENRHSNRLEWYIIILIVVEIILSLYELFIKPVLL